MGHILYKVLRVDSRATWLCFKEVTDVSFRVHSLLKTSCYTLPLFWLPFKGFKVSRCLRKIYVPIYKMIEAFFSLLLHTNF